MSYNGIISIDLTKLGEQTIDVATSNRLWLPKRLVRNGVVFTNPQDCIVGVRVQTSANDEHPWALQDGYVNSTSVLFNKLIVRVITKGAADLLCLATGTDVAAGYANNDGLSPVVGAGASTSGGWAAPGAHMTFQANPLAIVTL